MSNLRTRCNKCHERKSMPDTPGNRHKLEYRDIVCTGCREGCRYMVKGNRQPELDNRSRCHCDGVLWADMRNSPHDISTKGCIQYEDYKIDVALRSNNHHSDGDIEPNF